MKFELIQFSLIQLKYSILRKYRHSLKNEHYSIQFIVNAPVLGTLGPDNRQIIRTQLFLRCAKNASQAEIPVYMFKRKCTAKVSY